MANTIILKRSSTQGKVPTTTQLSLGEIAINTYDGLVYIKKDNGTPSIVQIGNRHRASAPSSNTGAAGDLKGDYAISGTDLYVCNADYDGSTSIWVKFSGSTSWS